MINVYTLNINDYFPEMMEITVPLMKKYADKIGANFIEINRRKFPDWHIHYEKLQIYELGKEADWNIFFDGDVLVHPDTPDFTKMGEYVFIKDGYRANIKFTNPIILNDKRNQGISTCFISSPKQYHNIWKPLKCNPCVVDSQIIMSKENLKIGINSDFYQDEFTLSFNLTLHKIEYSGIPNGYLFHSYKSNLKEEKLKELKEILSGFKEV